MVGFIRSGHVFLLAGIWCLIKVVLFCRLGVVIANDSSRYIAYADHLLSGGHITLDFDAHYIGYSLVIALCKRTGLGLGGVVVVQLLTEGLAMVLLYRMALHLFKNKLVAACTILSYACWAYAQVWAFYLLTDSLFASWSILVAYVVFFYHNRYRYWVLSPILCMAMLLRPQGYVLVLATFLFERYKARKKITFDLAFLLISITCLVWVNEWLRSYFSTLLYDNYLTGEVISGYNGCLMNPRNVVLPDKQGEPLWEMALFAARNPLYLAKLSSLKLLFFFAHTKPYYSVVHNVAIVCVLYPCYYFSSTLFYIKGSMAMQQKAFLLTFIIFQALIVACYMEDWDGRFLLPVLPFLFLTAIGRLGQLIRINDCH